MCTWNLKVENKQELTDEIPPSSLALRQPLSSSLPNSSFPSSPLYPFLLPLTPPPSSPHFPPLPSPLDPPPLPKISSCKNLMENKNDNSLLEYAWKWPNLCTIFLWKHYISTMWPDCLSECSAIVAHSIKTCCVWPGQSSASAKWLIISSYVE